MEQQSRSDKTKFIVTLISRVVTALVGIFFVPLYVKLIGIESYGLVSFYAILVGALSFLDLGLSTAISRQISMQKASNDIGKNIYDLIFSVEIIYWAISLFIGLLIILFSSIIAQHWITAESISVITLKRSVIVMGIIFVFQFPISIYNGVMIGMERQVANAFANMAFSIIKAVGVIFVLMFFNATVETYFLWQMIITVLFVIVLRIFVWSDAWKERIKAKFSVEHLKKIWRFAAGITGISIITFFISQIDKLIVSKMVTLEFVGYYNLAFLVAGAISQVISPMQPVLLPRFTILLAQNKNEETIELYHRSSRWLAIAVLPIGFTLILFAKEILMFWTKDPILTLNTAPILQIIVIGTICNSLMWIPYIFLLAKGNTKFVIYQNSVAICILVPLLFWLTNTYGILGASLGWLFVNAGYVLITVPLFHHYFLKGHFLKWLKSDMALPLISAGILSGGAKYFQVAMFPNISIYYFILLLFMISLIYIISIPELRSYFTKLKLMMMS